MQTIYELKEQAVTGTPLLLFDCVLTDGRVERWSTHRVQNGGETYEARVLRHNVFEIQASSEQGVDGVPRISLSLANADSHFSQVERSVGFKGARVTAKFAFHDLRLDEAASEATVVFLGVCNPPEEITESAFRISVSNRMNMQRVLLPPVRIQRRCPWTFPSTAEQRAEAVEGGEQGKYSRYYRCGYSPDAPGGAGLADQGGPFTSCGYTREDCAARGMTTHFGGIEFVPSTIQVRSYGEKGSHASALIPNEARYSDFVPMLYGTAWYNPPVVFARNDGNLTRMDALLGIGEMEGVVKVLVNDVEIPVGRTGQNMTGTGWYNVPTLGTRAGGFNLDFLQGNGTPAGDPYGSMAYLALVAPSRISEGKSLPTVKVLAQGLKLPFYDTDGAWVGESWSANPAWILLDVLRRSGWRLDEMDLASFARAAAHCDEPIDALDLYGNEITIPRFQCNLAVSKRRSAGDLIRGIRNAARLFLTYGEGGRVVLRAENTIAGQQPTKPAGSNSTQPLTGGWPAYEFGDGTSGRSGILRRPNGEPHLRMWSRSCGDTANRLTVEFQDAFNEYQQDSYSLVDVEDVAKSGQETSAQAAALGIPNLDQAGRILRHQLDKSVRGNAYVEFGTSVRALGLHPGDLITLTYLKEGFDRQPFRVLKMAPGANFGTAVITAQIHDDAWYLDSNGQNTSSSGGRREGGAGIGIPRPLAGAEVDEDGEIQFGVEEHADEEGVELSVSFTAPARPASNGPGIPLVSLAATVEDGGELSGGRSLYYAISGVNADGAEGGLSFVVRATLPDGEGKRVKLKGLSLAPGTTAFHAYRGATPDRLHRIASDQPPATEFIDTGAASQLIPAPDRDFDHANFYWRMELLPEAVATIHSSNSVGNGSLEMEENTYRGSMARITRGVGAGQERAVIANTATTVTVAPPWDIAPGAGSRFTIAEAGWKFGALSATSPVRFAVPDRPGETVQVTGRAANLNDAECGPEVSPVTRWMIDGSGEGDAAVPPGPTFGFSPGARGGTVEVQGIAFENLANTRTITSGTLSLHYWNELLGTPAESLLSGIDAEEATIVLNQAGSGEPGRMLQIGAEVLKVTERIEGGSQYSVERGMHGTTASVHPAGTPVYHLDRKILVLPFPEDFFGSPYSGNWSYPVVMPDVRLASAELFVTNRHGNSPTGAVNFTQGLNNGLRTLSGGQYTVQVNGFLAVDQSAAPALVVESAHAVRDVFAILGQAADSQVEVRVNLDEEEYCTVTIAGGQTSSNSADGFGLPLLHAGGQVSVSILSVGQTNPGSDLTVVIRL